MIHEHKIIPEPHTLLIVPGLGDGSFVLSFLIRNWKSTYGIRPLVHEMPWRENGESYMEKHVRLLSVIKNLKRTSTKLSLFGVSGGASAVIHAAAEFPTMVDKIIIDCGRLGEGEGLYPSLAQAGKGKPTFIEAVKQAEAAVSYIDPTKVLTLRPIWDEVVPPATVIVQGATNIRMPVAEHMISCLYPFIFPGQIIKFLTV